MGKWKVTERRLVDRSEMLKNELVEYSTKYDMLVEENNDLKWAINENKSLHIIQQREERQERQAQQQQQQQQVILRFLLFDMFFTYFDSFFNFC